MLHVFNNVTIRINLMNLKKLKCFLENEALHKEIVYLKNLNQGGTSINLTCKTADAKFLIKILPNTNIKRAERLLRILNSLKQISNIYSPNIIEFNEKQWFEFDNYIILIIEFINGKKLKYKELNETHLNKIYTSYQYIQQLQLDALPQRKPEEIYKENKEMIEQLLKTENNFLKKKVLNKLNRFNNLLNIDTKCVDTPVIIHGDASLNNTIEDLNKNIALLDFEMIRYGYIVEDWTEFLLSSVLQHSILFIPKRHLEKLIKITNNLFEFDIEQWKYGVNLYFLNLISKRLKSKKLFKSTRKAILFILNIKKHKQIYKILNEIY